MKKLLVALFGLVFTTGISAQTEGYKQAEKYCGQFGQKPAPGTNNNHSFSYDSNRSSEQKTEQTGAQYRVGGGGNAQTGALTGTVIQASGNINGERTSSRTDVKNNNSNSGTTKEYYNCK